MEYELVEESGFHLLRLRGKVDLYSSRDITREVETILSEGSTNLVVDFGGVTYIDSPGLGVLINAQNNVRRDGGQLALAAVPETIQRILHLTKLHTFFQVFPSVEDAAASFRLD